jgi:biotin carboxyl carrier protein
MTVPLGPGHVGPVRVTLAAELPEAPPPMVIDGRGPDGADLRAHTVAVLPMDPGAGQASGVDRYEVLIDGWRIEVLVEPDARAALRERARRGRAEGGSSGPSNVHAIIPGVIVAVSVATGDTVTKGQQLVVVEAMKMQNELRAPRDGTVEQVAIGTGSRVEVGDLLLVIG